MDVPSGSLTKTYGKIHHLYWEKSLLLWPFSIPMFVYQRVKFHQHLTDVSFGRQGKSSRCFNSKDELVTLMVCPLHAVQANVGRLVTARLKEWFKEAFVKSENSQEYHFYPCNRGARKGLQLSLVSSYSYKIL